MAVSQISGGFILMFFVAMAVLLPSSKWKRISLLAFNIIFYVFAGIEASLWFLVFSVFTYFGAKVLEKQKSKGLFFVIIALAFSPLLFFKYTDFFLSDILGLTIPKRIGDLRVPLGISFFTFQGVGYLVDVYKAKCKAERSFFNYFIFLSLFTCISSGPINRAEALLPQIREYDKTTFDYKRSVVGARYVLVGLFMKVFIVSGLLTTTMPSPDSGLALLISSVCYTVIIYCDFCGYSYMAFGLSQILGLSVVQNFNKPYFSASITEFWKRWHISLSSWLKDYVYIPLGGSRCSKIRANFNTIVTFLVSGIWHGANMTFVVWGLLNGIAIVVEKLIGATKKSASKLIEVIKHIVTLIIINTMWIFFKASTLSEALLAIKTICTKTLGEVLSIRSFASVLTVISQMGINGIEFIKVIIAFGAFLIYLIVEKRFDEPVEFFESKHTAVRWIKYILVICIILIFGNTGEKGAFIYADF